MDKEKENDNDNKNPNLSQLPMPSPLLLPFHKSKEERIADVKPIIQKLSELELNTSYPAIKRLYKEIVEYMKDGESRKIKIPFPEVKRCIKGFLSGDTRKETWVKLEADD